MILHRLLLVATILFTLSLIESRKKAKRRKSVVADPAPTYEAVMPNITTPEDIKTPTSKLKVKRKTRDQHALSICQKYCACSVADQLIECSDVQNFWSLVERGGRYHEEFATFKVRVSDPDIETIGLEFAVDAESENGLRGIKYLVLDEFPSLTSINPLFFQMTFPNLEHLTVTEGRNKLREVTVGFLPHLIELKVSGCSIAKVTGCDDDETYCFDSEFMQLIEVPTLTLLHMGLPDDINVVNIIPNDAFSPEDGDAHVFDGKTVEYLKYIMKSEGKDFPIVFDNITVNEEFQFELPAEMDDKAMEDIIADIHRNPSLYSRMRITVTKNDFMFPVYYDSCPDCDYNEIYSSLQKPDACVEEKKFLEKFNPDVDDLKNGDITIRGIYIDIDDIIKQVMAFKMKTRNVLTVYTFIAKKPRYKTVDFRLRIFYGVLDGPSNMQHNVVRPSQTNSTSMTFLTQEMFGTALKYAKRLDPLFVQSYSTCIAKMAADFKKNSPTRDLKSSAPWEMFINLPNTGIYATTKDALVNSRASSIQGLLTKYMYTLASDAKSLNKVPYESIDVQREIAGTLLSSAENVLEKKENFAVLHNIEEMKDKSSENLKKFLDLVNEAEIRLWEVEKGNTKSLVNTVTKQRELYNDELLKVQDAMADVKNSYNTIEREFKMKSNIFADGSVARHAVTLADVASELTSTLLSVTNLGKFDLSLVTESETLTGRVLKQLNQLKTVFSKIMDTQKKLKRIGKIFRKIEKIYKEKFDILKTDLHSIKLDEMSAKDTTQLSELMTRFTENIQTSDDIFDGVLAVYKARKFSNKDAISYSQQNILFTEEINIMDPTEEITAKEIIEWETVRNKIDKLFGHRIMMEIPEAGEYKAAIFNMITKGKALMQLKLDQTKLMADIGLMDKAYWSHVEEYASLEMSIIDTHAMKKARKIDYTDEKAEQEYELQYNKIEKDIYAEEFIAKLKLISAKNTFCQGFYYYHLKRCPEKYNIDIYTNLKDAINIYRSLVFEQNIRALHAFHPSPQTFDNIAVFIRKEENCACVQSPYATLKSVAGRTTTEKEQRVFRNEGMKNCFSHRKRPYKEVDVNDLFDKLDRCNMDRIKRFSLDNTISFDIPINFMKSFDRYERVRVDEVKVFLDGVKTNNGKVVMKIENSGLIKDRYKGDVFQFLGAPWFRNYEYCSKFVKKRKHRQSNDVPSVCMSRKFKTLVSTNIVEQYEGFYPKPTLFSTWVISVPKEHNPGLDMSRLKSVQINFSGSLVIGRANYSTYDIFDTPPHDKTEH